MKLHLVDDFERISKRYSVKLIKVGAALSSAWLALSAAGLTSSVPSIVSQVITTAIFIGAFIAAYIHQNGVSPDKDKP